MSVIVTDEAQKQLKEILKSKNETEKSIRINLAGYG